MYGAASSPATSGKRGAPEAPRKLKLAEHYLRSLAQCLQQSAQAFEFCEPPAVGERRKFEELEPPSAGTRACTPFRACKPHRCVV